MDSIGVGSLPIVTLTGVFMGLVLALQGIVELRNIGATSYIGRAVGTTVVRELGPVLSAMMVAARSGSAIAAELASMVVAEQIDALRAAGATYSLPCAGTELRTEHAMKIKIPNERTRFIFSSFFNKEKKSRQGSSPLLKKYRRDPEIASKTPQQSRYTSKAG